MRVRPTLRCVREDLRVPLPPADQPLDEIAHPLLVKANAQFADDSGPRERIRAVDDAVLFKVKVQRWRGAVLTDHPAHWLVAAGCREEGSRDDFYAALAAAARSARLRHNSSSPAPLTTDTWSAPWLPTADDLDRYRIEGAARLVRELRETVHQLVCASLLDGREHTAALTGAELGLLVRATDSHETYVALRVSGSVPDGLLPVLLNLVPGCERTGWFPEFSMPHRPLRPNEQVWSNLMAPEAAAEALAAREATSGS